MIDTNGPAGPNKEGYDFFRVTVTSNGIVLPEYFYNSAPNSYYYTENFYKDEMDALQNQIQNITEEIEMLDSEVPGSCDEVTYMHQVIKEMEENGEHDDDAIQYLHEMESACEDERNQRNEYKQDLQNLILDRQEAMIFITDEYFRERRDYRTLCKERGMLGYCGAYLYQNNFVMDY